MPGLLSNSLCSPLWEKKGLRSIHSENINTGSSLFDSLLALIRTHNRVLVKSTKEQKNVSELRVVMEVLRGKEN